MSNVRYLDDYRPKKIRNDVALQDTDPVEFVSRIKSRMHEIDKQILEKSLNDFREQLKRIRNEENNNI